MMRLDRATQMLARFRFTLLFLVAMILANAAAGTLSGELPSEALREWGVGQESVWHGGLIRLLTGTFLSHDVDMLLRQILFAAAVIGYTEHRLGSWRAALAFFGFDILSTMLLLSAVWLVPSLAEVAAFNDVGMSMGGFGLLGLAIAGLRFRLGLLALMLAGIATKIAIDFEALTDTGHVLAMGLGFVTELSIGRLYRGRHGGGPRDQ